MNLVERLRQKLNIGNELYRAALAEFFCTGFLLVSFVASLHGWSNPPRPLALNRNAYPTLPKFLTGMILWKRHRKRRVLLIYRFLQFGGCSVNAQFVLSQRRTNEWIAVAIGWGLVLLFAVQMSYRISGGPTGRAGSAVWTGQPPPNPALAAWAPRSSPFPFRIVYCPS